jgi:predicted CxxxxCH...CXXCH cytochrome family protein
MGTTAEWAAAASAQGGGHNSFGVSFPKTGLKAYGDTVNGVAMTGSFGSLPGTFVSGWSDTSPVTCTSVGCHNTTTAPNGPQGASVPWYQNNGAAVTGAVTTHWYEARTSGSTVPPATGCQNCHAALSSAVHRSDHNVACESCHVRIPHAWKRPRLLRRSIDASGTTTETVDALPYSDPTVLGLEGYKVTSGETSFSSASSCNVNCHGPHNAAAPYWP